MSKKKIKRIILNFSKFISSRWIIRVIIESYIKLDIKSKIKDWRIIHYLYTLLLIPMSILTIILSISLIEGFLAHVFGNPRCKLTISDIVLDNFCSSYYGLMIGVFVTTMLHFFIYWHYITSLKTHLFSSNR